MAEVISFMKKYFLFVFLLIVSSVISDAKVFKFMSAAGLVSFSQNEYVFQSSSKISELTWKCPAVPCIVAGVNTRLHNFEIDLSYLTTIPIKNGTLTDLDFGNSGISQFSKHNLYVDKKYSFTIQAGCNFATKNMSFFPFATFCYKNQKFSGRDGYYQYPEKGNWTGTEPKTNLKGNVISYESEFFIFGLGTSIRFISKDLSFEIEGILNPYIYGNALDSHYVRKKQFYDSFEGKLGFSLSSKFNYNQVFIKASYTYIPLLIGNTSTNIIGISDADFSEHTDFQGGTSFDSFSLIFGYKI